MADTFGHCDSEYQAVRDALTANLQSGTELGASIVVNVDGTNVVDIWGGWQDREHRHPWSQDTITTVWSTTKTITSLAALILVDRGLLDLHQKVSTYWPEFAQNGKEDVEVRHILGHTSGVAAWEQPFSPADSYDLAAATQRLATQPPWWTPGTASGYHASNYGHLVGELVRRLTGMSLREFVDVEIAGPVGADFQIGAARGDEQRIATIYPASVDTLDEPVDLDLDSVAYKIMSGSYTDPTIANTSAWRRADVGAANGHGNARSVARIMSAVALGGTTQGVRFLKPETIELIFEEQSHGVDLFLGIPLRWGMGFGLSEPDGVPFVPSGDLDRVCFWGGWGGSLIIMDLRRRMTISYVMNQMQPGVIGSAVSAAYCDAIYTSAAQATEAS